MSQPYRNSFPLPRSFARAEETIAAHEKSDLRFEHVRLLSGKSQDVELIRLAAGDLRVTLVPTRGLGVLDATRGEVSFGWTSPIAEPVHPRWVPVSENSGLGWLEGFNEFIVRCGMANNGAPEHDPSGTLTWPLHGRVANLPATNVTVDIDSEAGEIKVTGTVEEVRFHFYHFVLKSEITLRIGEPTIRIRDTVTNAGNRPASMQMLYHTNIGTGRGAGSAGILGAGSTLSAPIKKIAPRNQRAADNIDQWLQIAPATAGFSEEVYFTQLHSDQHDQTLAMVTSPDESKAVSVEFNHQELPCFTLWKNSVANEDGYVVGLEPATNFPNPKSFEEQQGRVVNLKAGQSHTMNLSFGLLNGNEEVAVAKSRIEQLQLAPPVIETWPTADWCS